MNFVDSAYLIVEVYNEWLLASGVQGNRHNGWTIRTLQIWEIPPEGSLIHIVWSLRNSIWADTLLEMHTLGKYWCLLVNWCATIHVMMVLILSWWEIAWRNVFLIAYSLLLKQERIDMIRRGHVVLEAVIGLRLFILFIAHMSRVVCLEFLTHCWCAYVEILHNVVMPYWGVGIG
jgi:hypothetical protein